MQQFPQYRKGLTALGAVAVLAALGACSGAATSPGALSDTQITEDIGSMVGNTVAEEASGFGTEETRSGAADVALTCQLDLSVGDIVTGSCH